MARREAAQRDLFRGDKFTRDQLKRAAEYYAKSNKTSYDAAREAIFRLTTTSKSARQGTEKTRAGVNRALSRVLAEDTIEYEDEEIQGSPSSGYILASYPEDEEELEECGYTVAVHVGTFDNSAAAFRAYHHAIDKWGNLQSAVVVYWPKGVHREARHVTKGDRRKRREVVYTRDVYSVDAVLCIENH